MQKWISVKHRLPNLTDKPMVDVLAYDGYRIRILTYERGSDGKKPVYRWRREWSSFSGVTHWMPLPEAPIEDCREVGIRG